MIRSLARLVRRTPLHPQWLLGPRRLPPGVEALAGRILDVGAGDRWIGQRLASNADYVALDYPATGAALYGAKPDVFADASSLPFRSESFDAVVCLEVLEHVRSPALVLAEISRVLKPGSRVWFSTPFLYPVHDAPFDYQRFTEHGWRVALEGCGLELVGIEKRGHAIATAGLLLCLAVAGGVLNGKSPLSWLMAPVAAVLIPAVNVTAWLMSKLAADWSAMGSGYLVQARKP